MPNVTTVSSRFTIMHGDADCGDERGPTPPGDLTFGEEIVDQLSEPGTCKGIEETARAVSSPELPAARPCNRLWRKFKYQEQQVLPQMSSDHQ